MTFTESIKSCFRKYITFSGRASRSEYWKFWLFWLLGMIFLTIVNSMIFGPMSEIERQVVFAEDGTQTIKESQTLSYNSGIFGTVFSLAVFLPGVAVAFRRLHDVGRSGLWLFMPIAVTLVVVPFLMVSTVGLEALVEAFRATGNVRVNLGASGFLPVLAIFGCYVLLLVWLCRKSQAGANKYGPNPLEATE